MKTAAVRALHDSLCAAMVAGDVAALDKILTADFTLKHMTGYVQSKSEWLDDIESGQMQYHRMETVEVTVDAEGAVPELTARTLTDATIWGARATWRLTLRSWFEPHEGDWVLARTVASTW
ncbi:hypothetical protein J2809_002968 [Arthrobacter pascens]|uniref:nuclear transport factor 2 family protein n=1 Tax=Arthrobacter pascens TaxID=1677 RepID=UPI00285B5F3A|nr:nuclear transport factor 2 family protein [Arthrobacter pascens]MDR6558598.1 hypothetical protein [Arthrobacter pascens]